MTIIDNYVQLAKRTESIVLDINDINLRFLHSIIGMSTEIMEFNLAIYNSRYKHEPLDTINLLEELTDCFWYTAIGCDVLGINFPKIIDSVDTIDVKFSPEFYANAAEVNISSLLDICKKHIFYRKSYDSEVVVDIFTSVIQNLYLAVLATGHRLEFWLEKNIEKLKSRYPEKYNDYHATNRDLENERKILES